MAWHGGSWRRAAHRRPMEDGGSPAGVCAQAVCHRPRPPRSRHGPYMHSGGGTGLGPLITPVPRRARAAWVRRVDVAGVRRRHALERRAAKTVSLSPFQNEFSPIFQTEVPQTLNTKVIKQVALYNNAKGSRVLLTSLNTNCRESQENTRHR
jgi:hypothetical protein